MELSWTGTKTAHADDCRAPGVLGAKPKDLVTMDPRYSWPHGRRGHLLHQPLLDGKIDTLYGLRGRAYCNLLQDADTQHFHIRSHTKESAKTQSQLFSREDVERVNCVMMEARQPRFQRRKKYWWLECAVRRLIQSIVCPAPMSTLVVHWQVHREAPFRRQRRKVAVLDFQDIVVAVGSVEDHHLRPSWC